MEPAHPGTGATTGPAADAPTGLTGEEVARRLGVDPATGLSGSEAARRLEHDGPNELRAEPPVPLWRRVAAQFRDPLVSLLLVAVAISLAAWVVEGADGVPVDSVVIVAVLVLNAIVGLVQEGRAASAVAALRTMTEAISTVLRDGELRSVPAGQVVVGDVLVLAEGDAVGADARLLHAAALRVQEASLTGESEAVLKGTRPITGDVPLGDRVNMVFKGTAVTQGTGRAVVTATGMATEVGAIAELLEATEEEPTPLEREIRGVSKVLGVAVVMVAVVVMVVTALVNDVSTPSELVAVLLLGVSLAVAAVPEGLPAILSVVLAIGVQRMARQNAVVKRLSSVETLGAASVVCSDKTGTLTRNEMTIQRVVTASGRVRLTGVGYGPHGRAHTDEGGPPDGPLASEVRAVLAGGSVANDAQVVERDGQWQVEGDPTEAAFLVAQAKVAGTAGHVEAFVREGEIPFTSERKMMSVVGTVAPDGPAGAGRTVLVTKGAPDVLLTHCSHELVGREPHELDEARRDRVLAAVEALSQEAFRTLAVAFRFVEDPRTVQGPELGEEDEADLVLAGVVAIIDPPRSEAAPAVAEAHRAGIRTIMITGDHPATAARIASDLGISDGGVLTGSRLDALAGEELRDAVRGTDVYARVAPHHKNLIVDVLQADGHVVAMTGDGVNDAPALKSADIGVAMGVTGTEVTKEAAQMILADDDYATIVVAVRQGRVIFDNIKKFLRYLLSSNMGEVVTVFLGVVLAGFIGLTGEVAAGGIAVPLLATQILWINLVTDSAPALAMGVDPEIDDVMVRRPRPSAERILDRRMWGGILSIGLVMGLVTLFTIDVFLPGGLVEGHDDLTTARTAGFTTLVLAQLFNALNSRSETTSAFHKMFVNPWLWGAIGLGAVLQVAVVEVPLLQTAFGTAPLDLAHWAVCVAAASVVLWFDEARKWVLRRTGRDGAVVGRMVPP